MGQFCAAEGLKVEDNWTNVVKLADDAQWISGCPHHLTIKDDSVVKFHYTKYDKLVS